MAEARTSRLSDNATRVLKLIAAGHSYSQILEIEPRLTYKDIFAAAQEALDFDEQPPPYDERILEIKRRYPRAYERWTREEDSELWERHRYGIPIDEIAAHLRRQPSAVRSRLEKHRLLQETMGWADEDE